MEMVSMDTLIIKIMNFAQRLVDAGRASLFLVDSKTNQLYARIFDVHGSKEEKDPTDKDLAREIR
jgi:cAMP and cAMP-inhibited cGMP 3',5'-cyclic phosphodiesterase 10